MINKTKFFLRDKMKEGLIRWKDSPAMINLLKKDCQDFAKIALLLECYNVKAANDYLQTMDTIARREYIDFLTRHGYEELKDYKIRLKEKKAK